MSDGKGYTTYEVTGEDGQGKEDDRGERQPPHRLVHLVVRHLHR